MTGPGSAGPGASGQPGSQQGASTGAAVREAATVMLLRDGPDGLQTWMLRRVPKMAFAPGMSVFPGGGVDAADAAGPVPATAAAVAEQFSTTVEHAAVLLRAAGRELMEETDVQLPLEALRPWARWITPEVEPRRYDTYFFVAAVPDGATAAAVTGEASHADWISVAQALAEYERDERPMLPPTVVNLSELASMPSASAVLDSAAARVVRPIQPTFRRDESGVWCADLGDDRLLPLPASFRRSSGGFLP
ncbi:MAG TPA: NUDIX hydrolase [Jatrophihabitans sp.]|uniref:NUDIX hydrolase n=1 Tax=Jatrophihabitans sp. TaxID=1932789 RepID=UPI002F1233D4